MCIEFCQIFLCIYWYDPMVKESYGKGIYDHIIKEKSKLIHFLILSQPCIPGLKLCTWCIVEFDLFLC